jgi:2-polyprenyl-3-methyl-5-hydroxy-6-metoxy-1,4-benzoquinol methylase
VKERGAEIEASWRANADAWTQLVRTEGIESRRLATNHAIVRAVLEHDPERVLDVGCGEGWLTRTLGAAGVEAVGFDSSTALVAAAQELGGAAYMQLGYRQFIEQPQQVGDGFDVAVCNFSILDDQLTPLARACGNVLAPQGRLIIQTVHPFADAAAGRYQDDWRTERFDAFGEAFSAPMPWYFRTVGSWVDGLLKAGLRLVSLSEVVHPQTGRPLSLLLVATQ